MDLLVMILIVISHYLWIIPALIVMGIVYLILSLIAWNNKINIYRQIRINYFIVFIKV